MNLPKKETVIKFQQMNLPKKDIMT
jgi:hypothetical protein